jgi:ligand-binding sensor domain-containing protein
LHVDSHGELWIGTLSGGLSRYDRRSDRFINYYNGPEGISSIDVRAIADDGAGGVWVATKVSAESLRWAPRSSGSYLQIKC